MSGRADVARPGGRVCGQAARVAIWRPETVVRWGALMAPLVAPGCGPAGAARGAGRAGLLGGGGGGAQSFNPLPKPVGGLAECLFRRLFRARIFVRALHSRNLLN